MNACARAGFSGSGAVIDPSARSDLSAAHYLKGVLMARLDGVKPPFNPGDELYPKNIITRPSDRNHWQRSRDGRPLSPPGLVIKELHYVGKDCWDIIFVGKDPSTTDSEWISEQDGGWTNHYPLFFDAGDFKAFIPESTALPV